MSGPELLAILSKYTLHFSNEKDLQDGLAKIFEKENLSYTREYPLSKGDRIDFLVQNIGIEVKTQGSYAAVLRQLWRYAESPEINELLLVTTKATHLSLAPTILEKPAYVFQVINL